MAKTSLSDSIYEKVLERIIHCHYRPGSLISEEQLVHELNASRTPIRSALIRLQQDNLVQILPKKGILVTEITPNSIRDLYNLRELIEFYAIENFGLTFPKEQLMKYLSEFSPACENTSLNQTIDADARFHIDIVGLTGNELLCSYYRSMQYHLVRTSYISGHYTKGRLAVSNNEHRDIILALLKDDLATATETLRSHLKRSRDIAYQSILNLPETQ